MKRTRRPDRSTKSPKEPPITKDEPEQPQEPLNALPNGSSLEELPNRSSLEPGNRLPRRSVQWNEDNLEENDKLKAELRPIKVDEPKTPFYGPTPMDEDEDGRSPTSSMNGSLNGNESSLNGSAHGLSPEPTNSLEAHGNGHIVDMQDVADALPPQDRTASDSDRDPGPQQRRKRHFRDKRRAHYQMRDALERGKSLASQSLSDPGEDDDEEFSSVPLKQ